MTWNVCILSIKQPRFHGSPHKLHIETRQKHLDFPPSMWAVVKDGRIRPHNLLSLVGFFLDWNWKEKPTPKNFLHVQQAAIGNQNGFCFQVPHHNLLSLMLAVPISWLYLDGFYHGHSSEFFFCVCCTFVKFGWNEIIQKKAGVSTFQKVCLR